MYPLTLCSCNTKEGFFFFLSSKMRRWQGVGDEGISLSRCQLPWHIFLPCDLAAQRHLVGMRCGTGDKRRGGKKRYDDPQPSVPVDDVHLPENFTSRRHRASAPLPPFTGCLLARRALAASNFISDATQAGLPADSPNIRRV